MNKNSNTHPW